MRLLLTLLAAPAFAFSPDVQHVQPRGGQRGTEMEIRFHGERLQGPQEILFHQTGIEVLGLTGQDDGKQVVAKLRIAPDAPLGEHDLRLRTAGGVSYLRSLWIGQLPTTAEAEPNNSFEAPQKIELNTTVEGVSQNEDEDFYSVILKKGQPLAVEVEAMRLGRTFFDAYVAILGPDRFELAACDDATLLRNDAFATITAPEDGEYRVVVREAAYQGSDASQYRLHIGTFPRPAGVFPSGARLGETIDFTFTDGLTRQVAIPETASGLFPVFAERDGLSSPSPNWIFVSPLAYAHESEPNQAPKQATPLPEIPCAAQGVLAGESDIDWFRFAAKKGENLDIRLRGRELRSPIDSVVSLRNSNNKQLAANDDQGSPDSFIQWTCPDDGDYLLSVRDKLGRTGPEFTYRLEIERRGPSISASLPVTERDNSQARKMITIPRGNRYATVVNINRSNLGCDAVFEAGSLPEGVTMTVPPIPRSLNNFPVIFHATPEAPVAGGWHPFTIRATGENLPQVSGPLRETVHHIEINNQGTYHSTESDKIAVAVTEEAPFTVTLDAPAVPLTQRGSLKLAAHVQRQGDFMAPVTLSMVWNPPGIGSPANLKIEEGQNDAGYEINANPDAPVADWQVCVLATADTPKGPVMVATDFVPLRVVDPWVTASIDLSATEQGRDVPVICKLKHHREFAGKATAELVGLPHGTSTGPLEFDQDTAELTFPITVAEDAAVGKHSGLFLRIEVPENGSTVLHQTGHGGTLRIDKPAPAVAETKAPEPQPEQPAEKPLSRLEQLRAQAH
ncbi:PPC domain-containing protein [Haloferula sargassicola]|uniref:Peptidase n=1 Tax=Haloferula sargassicola TaxID=490096 RepID=A0ABP9UNH3_9BACT